MTSIVDPAGRRKRAVEHDIFGEGPVAELPPGPYVNGYTLAGLPDEDIPTQHRGHRPSTKTTEDIPETTFEKKKYSEMNENVPRGRPRRGIAGKDKSLKYVKTEPPRGREEHMKLRAIPEELIGVKHRGEVYGRIHSVKSPADTAYAKKSAALISAELSTKTGGIDPTEAITRRLLSFQHLPYLWPQVVFQCGSRRDFMITIGEVLRHYSEDLSKMAYFTQYSNDEDSSRDRAAYTYVAKSRFRTAQKIWMAHYEGAADYTEGDEDIVQLLENAKAGKTSPGRLVHLILGKCERFLYGSEPITTIQSRVMALARFQHPAVDGLGRRICGLGQTYFSNATSLIYELPLKPGSRRLWWTCTCGQRLYDDYTELEPGGITKLEERLKQYCSAGSTPQDASASTATRSPTNGLAFISAGTNYNSSMWGLKKGAPGLPRHQASDLSAGKLGVCSVTPGTAQGQHNFMLMCVPFMRWVAKLWQAEVCRINSDRDFFRLLRYYYNQHGKRPWARLRKIEGVNFVKFEMYPSQLVDVQNCPDVPNETQALDNYTFDPLPAETNPPIGPRLLAHLLEHPKHAEVLPVLYRKFPKKLREKLQASPQKGSAAGWGIEFVEGLNWFIIFLCGCMGFLAALVSAIVWSVVRNDVQGGFAIAGFMLAFLGFCLGIARLEIQTV